MFNQELSFDMSKVMNMEGMFFVRPLRVPPPCDSSLHSWVLPVHAACAAAASRTPPGPHVVPPRALYRRPTRPLTPHRLCTPFASAEFVGVHDILTLSPTPCNE